MKNKNTNDNLSLIRLIRFCYENNCISESQYNDIHEGIYNNIDFDILTDLHFIIELERNKIIIKDIQV